VLALVVRVVGFVPSFEAVVVGRRVYRGFDRWSPWICLAATFVVVVGVVDGPPVVLVVVRESVDH
jgi:hypothetical protein